MAEIDFMTSMAMEDGNTLVMEVHRHDFTRRIGSPGNYLPDALRCAHIHGNQNTCDELLVPGNAVYPWQVTYCYRIPTPTP